MATASDDFPEAVGPKIATKGNAVGCTGVLGSTAEESAGITELVKSASSSESADKPKIARL
jgi:hypothetical protein